MSGKPAITEYDLLIVGGGLVGASLAAALAPLPFKIAVVEAVAFGSRGQPSFDDRITAISLGSQRIFESMGLWSALAAEASPSATSMSRTGDGSGPPACMRKSAGWTRWVT